MIKLIKKIKKKRCNNCIHKYEEGIWFCCQRPVTKFKIGFLRPLKLICFYRKEDKHE